MAAVRVLLLADTHIGFDDPVRPRIQRRRRGPDFLACFEKALEPALRGEVDLVVHGGDLLFRARVPATVLQRAIAPLLRVAESGVPVFLVPGNHERSQIPYPLLTQHPNLHIFREPCTFRVRVGSLDVAVSGFPFARGVSAPEVQQHVARTDWGAAQAGVRLLCMHQSVEGATVGVQQFTFRRGDGVIAGHAIPTGFAAVLSGHIHRHQILEQDLRGHPLAAPVCYPGSVERTSFAERHETKGYLLLELSADSQGGRLKGRRFVPLPARPMHLIEVDIEGSTRAEVRREIARRLDDLEHDAVVRISPRGAPACGAEAVLTASALRALAPPSMSVSLPLRLERRRSQAQSHVAR